MNINSLRLGNYIFVGRTMFEKPRRILGFDRQHVLIEHENKKEHEFGVFRSELISGIPLNIKILIQSGFSRDSISSQDFSLDHIRVRIFDGGGFFISFDTLDREIKEIKYLHELQNFFFETRNKELQINFNKK